MKKDIKEVIKEGVNYAICILFVGYWFAFYDLFEIRRKKKCLIL